MLDLVFLVGRIKPDGVFWGVCDLIMILGSLSANGWGCVPVLLVVWHRVSSTGACWSWRWVWVLRWRSLWELSLIDITWGREVSGDPMSWTWLSNLRGSGLTAGQSTKTLTATGQVRLWFLAFWEVCGLLAAFSRCSVGVVPHVDVFSVYLWGGRWSPHLTSPPFVGPLRRKSWDVRSICLQNCICENK